MNWLNSIDNILERGFGDDAAEYSQSTAAEHLLSNRTWSDDEDSAIHAEDNDIDEQEGPGNSEEHDDGARVGPPYSWNNRRPLQPEQNAVRPGNIRLRLVKDIPSSSDEDESDDEQPSHQVSSIQSQKRAIATILPTRNASDVDKPRAVESSGPTMQLHKDVGEDQQNTVYAEASNPVTLEQNETPRGNVAAVSGDATTETSDIAEAACRMETITTLEQNLGEKIKSKQDESTPQPPPDLSPVSNSSESNPTHLVEERTSPDSTVLGKSKTVVMKPAKASSDMLAMNNNSESHPPHIQSTRTDSAREDHPDLVVMQSSLVKSPSFPFSREREGLCEDIAPDSDKSQSSNREESSNREIAMRLSFGAMNAGMAATPIQSNKQMIIPVSRTVPQPPLPGQPATGAASASNSVASSSWSWSTSRNDGGLTDDEVFESEGCGRGVVDESPPMVEARFLDDERQQLASAFKEEDCMQMRSCTDSHRDAEVETPASEIEDLRPVEVNTEICCAQPDNNRDGSCLTLPSTPVHTSQSPPKSIQKGDANVVAAENVFGTPSRENCSACSDKPTMSNITATLGRDAGQDSRPDVDESERSFDVQVQEHGVDSTPVCDQELVTARFSRVVLNGTSDENKQKRLTSTSPFEVGKLSSTWVVDPTTASRRTLNCYGAFHVRVIRAQRLPCPIGSTVQAVVSLHPWKGRTRTERRTTFLLEHEDSSFDHGVCASWDDNEAKKAAPVSLVHAYASEATPIPTLQIQLMLLPLKLLEFSVCALTLPCDTLMKRPGSRVRQWFLTEMPDVKTSNDGDVFGNDQRSLIEIEAVFVPDDQSLGSSFISLGNVKKLQDEDDSASLELFPGDLPKEIVETAKESVTDEKKCKIGDDFVHASKPHLLRVKKFWKPATCAQCSSSLFGWGKASFRCEVCELDCCGDCRLHLDVQIPCGSAKAIEIVGKSIQNKLTINKLLEAMAPVDEEYEMKMRELIVSPMDGDMSLTDTKTELGTVARGEQGRVGVLKLSVVRACIFSDPMSPVSEPDDVVNYKGEMRPGDYYVRVCRTDSESSARTRTMPSGGSLKFEEASEMRLDVSHFGVDFFIEVVDAITDKPVGTSVLTTHGLLQQQRDLLIEKGQLPIIFIGLKPPTFKGKRRMTLELRTGVKRGNSSDFFVQSDSKKEQGEISGWLEISVGLEEDVKRLYGATPYECPPASPDSLDLTLLSRHISRISDIVEDIVNLFGTYQYVVSWKNPLLTGFCFLLFVAFAIKFDSEYVGCLPFLGLMLFMLASAFSRNNCKRRFVNEEADEWNAAEREIEVNYTLHRPIGKVNVLVTKGTNIRSRELGLAGNVGCRVFYDPLRCASKKQRESIIAIDKSAKTTHEIGVTESKFTSNPVWEVFSESTEAKRLRQVLPHHGHFFDTEEVAHVKGCVFPVLQPFSKVENDEKGENLRHVNAELNPWTASTGAIVCQVRFRDILNMLPGSDHVFGEVVVPLSMLAERGELSGWFEVLEVGATDFRAADNVTTSRVSGFFEPAKSGSPAVDTDTPKVLMSVLWIPPDESTSSIEQEVEASIVIQEELLRWEVTSRDKDKLKQLVVGGSMGAFKTVSGFAAILQVIQNFLGSFVNTVEAGRNLLNFTDPFKSSMVLFVVTLLWLVLSLLPTRIVLLVAGLAQFGITAKSRLEKILAFGGEVDADDDNSEASDLDENGDEHALLIWLKNAFRGLPTDEDLRKAYFWEGRRIGAKTRESYASEKRLARLKRLWRAQWHATLKIRVDGKKSPKKSSPFSTTWESIFAVVQGRRFLWWKSVTDFDNGAPPSGRIFLAGHAGLSGLSPLEMREINPKDVPLVVCIFGRGLHDQQRITLLLPSAELKDSLEDAVIDVSVKED